MESPILEALPAIHVTIIGVIAAFFSAFAIYAYQKVNDAKEKLDSALKHSMGITSPSIFMINGSNNFLKKDGTLDWDDAGKETLRKATSMYSYLDYEEKYGIQRSQFQRDPDAKEVIALCDELFLLLSTVFTSYPFWNNNMVHVQGQTEQVSEVCSEEFDAIRIEEMQRIIGYLSWTWRTYNRALMMLARKGMELSQIQQMNQQQESFKKAVSYIPNLERERIWKQFHEPHINQGTNFVVIFDGYFEKIQMVEREIVPLLTESLASFTTYNQTFSVKETTLKVISLIAFNLLIGVFLPLMILNILVDTNFNTVNFWFSAFEYYVLLITMFPYFWACRFLFKKVKGLR